MANTLVGVYDRFSEARGAYDELLSCGFDRGDLQLSPSDESSDSRQSTLSSAGTTSTPGEDSSDQSFGAGIRHFFHNLFSGNDEYQEHADVYAEAVRRGHYLVTVHTDSDEERVQATQVMNKFSPIDIDERAAGWRSRGWSRYDETAPALNDSEIEDERRHYSTSPSMGAAAAGAASMGAATNASDATIADTSRADETVSANPTYSVRDTTPSTDNETYRATTDSDATTTSAGMTAAGSTGSMAGSDTTTDYGTARADTMPSETLHTDDMMEDDRTRADFSTPMTSSASDTTTTTGANFASTSSDMPDRTVSEPAATRLSDADTTLSQRHMTAAGTSPDSRTIPVIQEELQVGKREVQRGGVRVYQRVKETPVDQSVRLHEEHVHVERHSVDRPASEADLSGLKESSFELRETAEEAVIGKTARIVEEVVVSKEASDRTQEIHDKVRRTDVEVEQLSGTDRDTSGRNFLNDDEFRQHFSSAYTDTSDRFEDYEPAYRYGSTVAADERFRGHNWDESEEDVHADWESRYGAATPWEKAKNAVRYGWEKATR
ncbi:uncharacterized protein (TIGR02271 family) [Paucimonas lemoignei]|uniref:Uncharacterized protein (TIGR02271 family) n=1 Tax=Paucimonas lemoignei TaxID=29443 RepID=A0A4R3HR46_PAULE|nr:YsnF/AvaK domain-containing protein [Paucimonas lemoignei]TCS35576.1 uncharacterized protein (TIGR02271 family) [Paucimonas lemoignei]